MKTECKKLRLWGLLFTLFVIASEEIAGQALTFDPDLSPPTPEARVVLPGFQQIEGWVYDQYDKPVEGAWVRENLPGNRGVFTDASGRFVWGQISPATEFIVEKDNHLTCVYKASELNWFVPGENKGETSLRLPVFDLRFAVGPRGGTFRGIVDIEVPAGAVDEMHEIKVAVLPEGFRTGLKEGFTPVSYGAAHFEPAGLHFNKPIRVRQTSAGTIDLSVAAPGLVQLIQTPAGMEMRPVPEAAVVVNHQDWYYALSHFSEYRLVDNNHMVKTEKPGTEPADLNMDGAVNEQDAERVLQLEGGTHKYEYKLSFKQTQTLSQSQATGDRSASETTNEANAGASFSGISLGASAGERNQRARELAERFGFEWQAVQEKTGSLNMEVGEYKSQCQMVFARFDTKRYLEYKKHTPSARELETLQAAYKRDMGAAGKGWTQVSVRGGSDVVVGRTLHDGMKLAIHKNDKGDFEVFALTNTYILRTLTGFESGNCDKYASPANHRLRYGEYHINERREGAELYTLTYKGYAPLAEPNSRHNNCECGTEVVIEIKDSRSRMGFKEITASSEKTTEASSGVSGGLKIALPKGLDLEAGASSNTTRTHTANQSTSYGINTSEQDETALIYTVVNAHEEHESDHEFYRLFHVFEMRDWYFKHPNEMKISEHLRNNMRKDITTKMLRGETADGRLVLLRREGNKEYWYEAGPPVELIREAGYLLKRIAERPCSKPIAPSGKSPQKTDIPDKSNSSSDLPDEASRSRFRTGATLNISDKPSSIIVSGHTLADDFARTIFSDPALMEQLFESLGGEFILGEPVGQIFQDVPLQGKTGLIPGIGFGARIGAGLELCISGHYFKSEWSGKFPVTVFSFSGTAPPRTDQGVISASASGILTDATLAYLLPGRAVRPYIEAGVRGQIVLRSSSGIDLAGVAIPFAMKPVSNQIALYAGAGVRVHLGSHAYLQAGASFTQWPGGTYAPGGSVAMGWRF